MNVLNVLNDERLAGPQFRVLQVAARLREQGIRTVVVIPKGDPAFASLLKQAQVPCEEVSLGRARHVGLAWENVKFMAHFWADVRSLQMLIRRHEAHIVHVNGLRNLQPSIAARLEGVPLVWHLNDTITPWMWRSIGTPICRAWADRIVVASKATASHYFGRSEPKKLSLVYPPVDVERYYPGVDPKPLRSELGIPDDSIVIGTVGNVHPGKGIDLLLEATPQIRAAFPSLKVLVAGDLLESRRSYWISIKRRIQALGLANDFLLLGRRYDIPQVLAALSVYVHPARWEPAGMAVLEACASGIPVVAANVGGISETIADGVTGLLIPPESPAAIARATIQLLTNPDVAKAMGKQAARRVRDRFSLEFCAAEHVRLYQEALENRRADHE